MARSLSLALLVAVTVAAALAGCAPPSDGTESKTNLDSEPDSGLVDTRDKPGVLDAGSQPAPVDAGELPVAHDAGGVEPPDGGEEPDVPDAGDLPTEGATVASLVLLADHIALPSTAVGRRPFVGLAPVIALTDSGYTHPSVIYVPEGWNGFQYWMAVSPYFGPIGHDDQFENPHIFRSSDGLHWEEPPGIRNPIDLPPDAPSDSYWSDPHLVLSHHGALHCFYRGAGPEFGGRSLHFKSSFDGIHWSPRQLSYSAASLLSIDYTNKMLSPAVVPNGDGWDVFDAIRSSPTGLTIPEQKNQTSTFVMRRSSPEIGQGYGEYDESQAVTFTNRPWGLAQDPWHLDVRFFQGRWFMLLNTGSLEDSSGDALWLAVSRDGSTYSVIERPLFPFGTYRSAIVPIDGDRDEVELLVYRARISDGSIDVFRMRVRF